MSDPFKPELPDKETDLDKAKPVESSKDETALVFGDVKADDIAKSIQKQQVDPTVEKSLGSLDIEFTTGGGTSSGNRNTTSGAQFQLRKSEYTRIETEKPFQNLRPLIQDFLKNTPLDAKLQLSDLELQQLTDSREALSNATNTQEAASDALHLARLYQHMRYIEEAKKAIDLSLGLDPDHQHSKQLFRELERMHPADIGANSRAVQALPLTSTQPLTKTNLRKRILSLTGGRLIVVGDLLIDELLEGKPERISREAPVLILEHVDTELIPGGAANTANNIASMGGICHAIGVCGNDEYADKMAGLLDRNRISHSLVRDPSRPTTVKTRILSKSHSFKQQLLRLDRISHESIGEDIEQQLVAKLKEVAGNYSAVLLSDYRAGVMTDGLIRACRAIAAENKLMLIVDAQDDFARFQNVTLLTPNQPDTEKAVGFAINSKESLQKAGDELMMMTGASALLVTRGGEGMVLFQENEPMAALPAFNKSEVFDVSGAGDTVVATMALALVTGSTFLEAMALGNLAAGIVVKKPGTAVTSQKEMLENLDLLKIDE